MPSSLVLEFDFDDKGPRMSPGEDKEVSMAKSVLKKMVGGVRRILPSSRGDVNPGPKNIGSPMNPRREFHVTVNDDAPFMTQYYVWNS